jgi:hypothetical protein
MSEDEKPDDREVGLNEKLRRAYVLISALWDERITPDEFGELDSLVCSDVQVSSFYVEMVHLNASLRHFASYFAHPVIERYETDLSPVGIDGDEPVGNLLNETMVLPSPLELPHVDYDEDEERFQPAPAVLPQPGSNSDTKQLNAIKWGSIAAVVLLGLSLSYYFATSSKMTVPVVRTPAFPPQVAVSEPVAPPVPLATLDLSSKVVWGMGAPAPQDVDFMPGQLISLQSGALQLKLHKGGKIVLEGPAELLLVSDTLFELHSGKIAANIPGGGLTIRCPTGSVTDLGTEFGISVDDLNGMEVDVFKGNVAATLKSDSTTQPTSGFVLRAGQAAVVTDTSIALSPSGAVPQRFVCNLINDGVSTLDVTDLVSGGDGTTRRRGIGIDGNSGWIGKLGPRRDRTSDGKYHRVSGYPVIDGAFIPDGTKPDMTVDSAGDVFNFAPAKNKSFNNIYTGGDIPWPDPEISGVFLNGVNYATGDHGVILLHANNAITLDLSAIRRIYPDRALLGFECKVGNGYPADRAMIQKSSTKLSAGSARVLVDGKSRYFNPHFTSSDGGFNVMIPLSITDRFLTLVSTDAGDGNHHDWIAWVDAKINLSARR